ncbi:hypothetical protein CK501_14295 [Halovibrio salipaludis]|uniref:Outer membrane protein beta-barrel domain-containing protein n=1 Tax=Halovibrio salipaludis TaxID=2032626 RepID=A0A2A2EXG8_9GAMM|nr:hypothetical protein [Halovibrio salipaludis]PAU77856.1 hypothetical protein CK501_14295 [Halovibrio salipaludis]
MSSRFFVALLAVLAMPVWAQGPSFSYAEAGLALYPNFESETLLGARVRGSQALNTQWFMFGGLKALTGDIDVTALHGGGGYRHSVDHRTDVWGGLTLEYQEVEVEQCVTRQPQGTTTCSGVSSDDTAPGLRGGIRRQLHRDLEIGASARYVTGDLDYLGFTGTARYRWQPNVRVLAEADYYDGNFGVIGGLSLRF